MKRLDVVLVELGLCETREKAKRAILAAQILVNGQPARKPSDPIKPNDLVTRVAGEKYVSRGGLKLEHALHHFSLDVRDTRAIDVGASTGGFTDCLLQHGAATVFAVDVGRGQLAWKLRQDPRVVVMEKTNARDLLASHFPQPFVAFDLAVVDCSFISLRKVLLPVIALLRPSANILALIKPQFEAGKAEADKGAGVITDPAIHARVLDELKQFVIEHGWNWRDCVQSPLLGPAGNKEFLTWIEKTD